MTDPPGTLEAAGLSPISRGPECAALFDFAAVNLPRITAQAFAFHSVMFPANRHIAPHRASEGVAMATLGLIEYPDASAEVRAVYDDIMATRKTDRVNNFWKALARDPATLRRTWESVKQIMGAGVLDPLTKEMIYLAVSATNQCGYCIASHTAAARKTGMTDSMFAELMAVVGMANETNRLASGYQVEIDEQFKT
jgi:AhpD family alkylhydroperoxidase